MEYIGQLFSEFKAVAKRPRKFITQTLNLAAVIFWALMLWKGLIAVTNSVSPVVVVLSGSMEPAYQRGDILFLNNDSSPIFAGEVVVFKLVDRDIPIVHRVVSVHEYPDGRVDLLTKGDNNEVDDRGLYSNRQMFINREHLMGRVRSYLPYFGFPTIMLNDYPAFKFIVLGFMGFLALLGRD